MGTAALAIRIVLAAVFATAGVGKLRDLEGSRGAIRDFGISETIARPAGLLLPLAELAAAVLLVLRPTAVAGAAIALALLLLFIAGITNALRHGVTPDCHCFGQIHSAPAGRETLIRNGVLAGLAIFGIAAGPGPAVDSWVSDQSAAVLVAVGTGTAAAGLGFWAFLLRAALKRVLGELASARKTLALVPPGLPVGTQAPDFALRSVDSGETVTLESLRSTGQPVLLMFTAPKCGPCSEIFPSLRRWQQTLSDHLTVALVTTGSADDNQYLVDEHGLERLLVQEAVEVIGDYRIRSTPSAVLITPDGQIGTTTAQSVFEIEPMVRHALRGGDLAAISA